MSTDSQTEANRRNAKMSTGPKTSSGKAVSALNSLKHGLLSQEILLPNEDGGPLAELGEHLTAELNPVGEFESVLVDRIIGLIWRLGRLNKIEAGVLTWSYYRVLAGRAREQAGRQSHTIVDLGDLVRTEVVDEAKQRQELSKARDYEAAQEQHSERLLYGTADTRTHWQNCRAMRPHWNVASSRHITNCSDSKLLGKVNTFHCRPRWTSIYPELKAEKMIAFQTAT